MGLTRSLGGGQLNQPNRLLSLIVWLHYLLMAALFAHLLQAEAVRPEYSARLGLAFLVGAVPLAACTLWLLSRANGFPARVNIMLSGAMGLLSDLMVLRGLEIYAQRWFGSAGLELGIALLTGISLIVLAVGGNAEGLARQVRERQAQESDALTGLLNRHGVTRRYAELPAGRETTVVMLDLNDLKAVNDLGGHSAGDQHLRRVARALQRHLPPAAFLGRWGGDEFVLVLRGAVDLGPMMAAVQQQAPHPDPSLPPFAYGSATVPSEVPLDRALAMADQNMYEAKASGYGARAGQHHGRFVPAMEFPHYLLGLADEDAIVKLGMQKAAELAEFEAWFYLNVPENKLLGQHSLVGAIEEGDCAQLVGTSGIVAHAISQGKMLWAADYERSPFAQPHWVEAGLKSTVVAPVKVNAEVVGVVGFMSHHTWHSITPQARQLLEAVATHLGHHLGRSQELRNMRASVEAGIVGMGVILEARDLETAGHTARVEALANRLGRAAGLGREQLYALRIGALLHDVGKLAIPDAILLKPGPLDEREWSLMKTHAAVGASMASRIPSLPPDTISVVRSHHERWDGTGYPEALRGDAIPLPARIFALCDVYDALTSVRVYKRAWTVEEARAEVAAQAGRQFDPALTQLFLQQVLPEHDAERRAAEPSPRPVALAR